MSDIQRTCPQCQAILEVPADAVGKQAQCPACQHVFTVVAAETPPTPPPGSPQPETPPQSVPPQPGPPQPSASGQPPLPPRSAAATAAAISNPYAPSQQAAPAPQPRSLAPVQIRTADPAEYINATWSLFRSGWRPLVAAGTLAFVINAGSSLLGMVLTVAAQESGNAVFALLNAVLRVILGLASLFVTLGMMRMCVDLTRGQTIRFSHVFQTGFRVYGLALLGYFLLILPLALLVLPVLLAGVASGFAPNAMAGTGLICLLPLLIVVFALFLYLWSYMYFLVDRETGLRSAFRLAFQLGRVNKLNTVILLMLSLGLSTAGVCACFVGQVASVPATVLLAGVAYLQMTGQPIVLPPSPHPSPVPPEATP